MPVETQASVKEIIQRTLSVRSFRVVPDVWASFEAGQWLLVAPSADPKLRKPLSISSAPCESGYLEFTKKLTESAFSAALAALKPGDRIGLRYPQGHFVFRGDCPKIAFLSGGIGITPIRSICRDLTERKTGTDIVVLYGNRSPEEIAFKDDFDSMLSHNPAMRVVHILQTAPPDWKGPTGYVTEALIRHEVPDYRDRRFFLCGPPPMVDALKKMLLEPLALPPGQIVTEGFAGYS
jgi:ferredoxin-NADP reductase